MLGCMGDGAGSGGRRSIDAVEAEMAGVCGVLNAAHARLVALVAEALAHGLWVQAGIRSPEHWLAWKSGLSPHRAAEIGAIARRTAELPVTMATFTAGRLAVDQVTPIARHAPSDTDSEVCSLATQTTVTQLRRTLSTYCFTADTAPAATDTPGQPGDEPDDIVHRPERVAFGFADDGRFWLHADLHPDRGATVEGALRHA